MSNDQKIGDFTQYIKLLGETGGHAAAILGYILAIVGYPPDSFSAYSTSFSALIMILSVIGFWRWRWPKIIDKKLAQIAIPLSPTKQPLLISSISSLFLNKPPNPSYSMSLMRRQIEIIFLLLLTIIASGMVGGKFSFIVDEINGLHCINKSPYLTRIIITNFDSSNSALFGNRLANIIEMQGGDKLQVCKYRAYIALSDEAIKLGTNNNQEQVTLVVWGNEKNDLVDMYFTAINWSVLNQRKDAISTKDEEDNIVLISRMILTEILYNQNKVLEAQEHLLNALEVAKSRNLDETSSKSLAEGYFLLGLLFDPNQLGNNNPLVDHLQSRDAYVEATRLNPDIDEAYQNLSSLYAVDSPISNIKGVIKYCEILIEKKSKFYYVDASWICGQAYLVQGDYRKVIDKLGTILQLEEIETHYLYADIIHILGKAYLLDGDFRSAEQTYQRFPSLTPEEVQFFIDDLHTLSDPNKPDLDNTIRRIANHIQ